MMKALVVILALVASCACAQKWEEMDQPKATMFWTVSFVNEQQGYTAGMTNAGSFILKTEDGGQNWVECPLPKYVLIVMDVLMDSATSGVGSGLSFLETANMYTKDGTMFNRSTEVELDTACQSAESVPVSLGRNGYGLTGQFGRVDGVAVSHDGGKFWKKFNWGADTISRYGAFPTENTWYVAGGEWPEDDPSNSVDGKHVNQYITIPYVRDNNGVVTDVKPHVFHFGEHATANNGTWKAVIMKTTDGGKTFTEVYRDEGRYYMNQISCGDENTCWAVAEGNGAVIIATTDGGKTWTTQHTSAEPEESLLSCTALSTTEAWAAGALMKSKLSMMGRFYHTVDGGQTWDLEELSHVSIVDLDFISPTSAWAASLDAFGGSSLVRYH